MKGLVFRAPYEVSYEQVEDPRLEHPADAIVRVEATALCGSDLHPYRGHEKGLDPGTVMGHELVGEVVEVGAEVKRLKPGCRVFSPFTTSCGRCRYCLEGLTCRCQRGQLFGWREEGRGLHGTQADYVRVPLAEATLMEVPEGLPAEVALLLGDNLATGYFGAMRAEAGPGRRCAVVGCGSVGLLALLCCRYLGAETVYAVDPLEARRLKAAELGARPLAPEECGDLRVDSVVEAVGHLDALKSAFAMTDFGGTLASVGVHTGQGFGFTPVDAYDRNLTYRSGRCPARHLAPLVLPLAQRHSSELADLFSHRMDLSEGAEAYRLFESRSQNCLKVLLAAHS